MKYTTNPSSFGIQLYLTDYSVLLSKSGIKSIYHQAVTNANYYSLEFLPTQTTSSSCTYISNVHDVFLRQRNMAIYGKYCIYVKCHTYQYILPLELT